MYFKGNGVDPVPSHAFRGEEIGIWAGNLVTKGIKRVCHDFRRREMRSKVDANVDSVLDLQPEIRRPTTGALQAHQRHMSRACAAKLARKPSPTALHSLPGPVPRASEIHVDGTCV